MAIVIATLQAPNAQIATLVAKAIGSRFSLTDEAGRAKGRNQGRSGKGAAR